MWILRLIRDLASDSVKDWHALKLHGIPCLQPFDWPCVNGEIPSGECGMSRLRLIYNNACVTKKEEHHQTVTSQTSALSTLHSIGHPQLKRDVDTLG